MVHPNEILESLRVACNQADVLSEDITYSTVELDAQNEHANVPLPIVEFVVDYIDREETRNTEKIGTELDDDGNEIGYIYQSWFTMGVDANVLTASRGAGNHREIDQDLRNVLYQFDDHGMQRRPPNPDNPSETLNGISHFAVSQIQSAHDFTKNPTLRARQIDLTISYVHTYYTTDIFGAYDYVEDVEKPTIDVDG